MSEMRFMAKKSYPKRDLFHPLQPFVIKLLLKFLNNSITISTLPGKIQKQYEKKAYQMVVY